MGQDQVTKVKPVNWRKEYENAGVVAAETAQKLQAAEAKVAELTSILQSKERTCGLQADKILALDAHVKELVSLNEALVEKNTELSMKLEKDHEELLVTRGKNEILQGFIEDIKKQWGVK